MINYNYYESSYKNLQLTYIQEKRMETRMIKKKQTFSIKMIEYVESMWTRSGWVTAGTMLNKLFPYNPT